MTVKPSKSNDVVFSAVVLVLIGVVVGHFLLDELLVGVQWFAGSVVEPMFGLDELF